MEFDLAVIIVNWNLKDDTIECIESLLKAGASPEQIILIDNGSTDGSISAISSRYSERLPIIDAKRNLGFAEGINLGIQYALTQKFQWILLLNNDTVVAPNFIDVMSKASLDYQEYSILTPIILYYDKPSKIWYLGDRRIGNTLLTLNYDKNREVRQNLPALVPIDFANGSAMMVKRSVFERIGMMDGSLFMYAEEVDFCWRANLAGFKFACVTSARIWHKISKSSLMNPPLIQYFRIRNQIYFYRRYSHGIPLVFTFLFTVVRIIQIVGSNVLQWRNNLILPSLRGWLDGWFNKLSLQTGG